MINANELRIGNWVSSEGKNYKVLAIDPLVYHDKDYKGTIQIAISEHDIVGRWFLRCDPIELTPEILRKCGFMSDKDGLVYTSRGDIPCEDNGKNYPALFFNKRLNKWMDCHTRVCVQNLHQLQNLFYAHTNTELPITL